MRRMTRSARRMLGVSVIVAACAISLASCNSVATVASPTTQPAARTTAASIAPDTAPLVVALTATPLSAGTSAATPSTTVPSTAPTGTLASAANPATRVTAAPPPVAVAAPTTAPPVTAPPTTAAATVGTQVALARCVSLTIMSVGMKGNRDQVALLQATLARRGFDPGLIDGYFGNNTFAAAADSQAQYADGTSGGNGVFVDEQSILEPVFTHLGIAC